jgi:hypothetical protein
LSAQSGGPVSSVGGCDGDRRVLARLLQPIQSGDVNWYLLNILVVVIAAYFIAAR